jgi:glutathione synthase/RimK-type ligase-like ATP-grasp enzyme
MDSDGPFMQKVNPLLVFHRAGLPVPRWVYVTTTDRDVLRRYVERMGGFPVVVKFPGFSRGIGVIRVDSLASLFSLVDYTLRNGSHPVLCSYVDPATHWRAVVVGDRVVPHYRNVTDEDDFRTSGRDNEEDYRVPAPPGLEQIAVAAVRALGDEFGGVDILEHSTGRLYLIESNNPCYFATGQLKIGTDVSGAMIDHLLQKSKKMDMLKEVSIITGGARGKPPSVKLA